MSKRNQQAMGNKWKTKRVAREGAASKMPATWMGIFYAKEVNEKRYMMFIDVQWDRVWKAQRSPQTPRELIEWPSSLVCKGLRKEHHHRCIGQFVCDRLEDTCSEWLAWRCTAEAQWQAGTWTDRGDRLGASRVGGRTAVWVRHSEWPWRKWRKAILQLSHNISG